MVQPANKRLVTEATVGAHVANQITTPGTPTATALNATFAPKWKANTAYLAGDPVLAPTGEVVTAKVNFTSSSAYNAANWNSAAVPALVDAADTKASITKRWEMTDTAGAKGSMFNFEHFADGSGRPIGLGAGQTYAVDIHNNPGAKSAIVVHQYSNGSPAVRLDNTGTGTMLLIAQTNNPARNPESVEGGNASGNAFAIVDSAGNTWARFDGRASLIMTPPADATQHTIDIATNAGSTKRAIKVAANSAAPAVEIQANAGSTGQYPLLITGYTHGAQMTTSQSGGFVLGLTRLSTGSGDVANFRNDGTGKTLLLRQGTTSVAQFNADGELENLTAGKGHIMKSPDGTRYRVSVANGGTLSVVAA